LAARSPERTKTHQLAALPADLDILVRQPFDVVRDRLAVFLGPNTARTALRTFAQKSVGAVAEDITVAQAKIVVEALRPMLKTLVGAAQCERIIAQLAIELELRT
jgi:hypothetical protein